MRFFEGQRRVYLASNPTWQCFPELAIGADEKLFSVPEKEAANYLPLHLNQEVVLDDLPPCYLSQVDWSV